MPMITAKDGTQLFARAWGEGPPIVFAHGWACNSEIWQPELALLAERGFTAIAYDRRGHGRSDDPGRGYDYDTMADDLAAVLAHFGATEATLVGHSMGNGEIVRYLTRHGTGRVARVVMVAPSLPYPMTTDDNPEGGTTPEMLEAMRGTIIGDMADWLGQVAPPAFGPDVGPERIAQTVRMMLQCNLKAAIETNRANVTTDFRRELAALATPILVLQGDADFQAPLETTGRRVAAIAPDARLKVYPGGLHTIVASHAGEIAADIMAFVAETTRGKATASDVIP
jgi:non-heme chloroperoxidase